jgi:hypothetical protein
MPRNPSKILSAKEAKVLDLDQQIAEAQKEAEKAQKASLKATKVVMALEAKRDKAAAKKLKKSEFPFEDTPV